MKMLQYNKRKQFLHATITHIADLLTSCWMDDENQENRMSELFCLREPLCSLEGIYKLKININQS